MILTIPAIPLSLNQLPTDRRGKRTAHWSGKRKERLAWNLLVRSQLPEPPKSPSCKMRVKITLCHSRLYDADNAYGSVKPVVDALRDWKLVVNDTAEWLDLEVLQSKCPHKLRHTIIEIQPA